MVVYTHMHRHASKMSFSDAFFKGNLVESIANKNH